MKSPMTAMLLAASCPGDAAARARMRDLYERCLAHYRRVLRAGQPDADVNDVGTALAHFVAANMQALHGTAVTPALIARLRCQLGDGVRSNAAWAGASARQRQIYVEKLAIIAVLIGETWVQAALQGPAAVANVRHAANGYLNELIGLDPEQLALDDARGLALRLAVLVAR